MPHWRRSVQTTLMNLPGSCIYHCLSYAVPPERHAKQFVIRCVLRHIKPQALEQLAGVLIHSCDRFIPERNHLDLVKALKLGDGGLEEVADYEAAEDQAIAHAPGAGRTSPAKTRSQADSNLDQPPSS